MPVPTIDTTFLGTDWFGILEMVRGVFFIVVVSFLVGTRFLLTLALRQRLRRFSHIARL